VDLTDWLRGIADVAVAEGGPATAVDISSIGALGSSYSGLAGHGQLPSTLKTQSQLIRADLKFDGVDEEYATLSETLEELTQIVDSGKTARTPFLRKRQAAVEEEQPMIIEGYRPI